jgi:hypothetical protein
MEEQPKFVRPSLVAGFGAGAEKACKEGAARLLRLFPVLDCAVKLIDKPSDATSVGAAVEEILSADMPAELGRAGYIIQEVEVGAKAPIRLVLLLSAFDASSLDHAKKLVEAVSSAGDNPPRIVIVAMLGDDPSQDSLSRIDSEFAGLPVTVRYCLSQRNEAGFRLTVEDEVEVAAQAILLTLVPSSEPILMESLPGNDEKEVWQSLGASSWQVPYHLAVDRMSKRLSSDLSKRIISLNEGPGPGIEDLVQNMAVFSEIKEERLFPNLLREIPATAVLKGRGKWEVALESDQIKLELADTPTSEWVEAIARTDRAYEIYIASMWAREMEENLERIQKEFLKLLTEGVDKILSERVDGLRTSESVLNELESRLLVMEPETPEVNEPDEERQRLESEIRTYPNWFSFGIRFSLLSVFILFLWYNVLPRLDLSFLKWMIGAVAPPVALALIVMIYVSLRRNRLHGALDSYIRAVVRKYESIILANLFACRQQVVSSLLGSVSSLRARIKNVRNWLDESVEEFSSQYSEEIVRSTNQTVYLLESEEDLSRLYDSLKLDVGGWPGNLIKDGLFVPLTSLEKDALQSKLGEYCLREMKSNDEMLSFRHVLALKGIEPHSDKLKTVLSEMASRSAALYPRCERQPRKTIVLTPPDVVDVGTWENRPGTFGEYGLDQLEYDLDTVLICQAAKVSTDGD